MRRDFWVGKRVFVTGHTGFKGGWLCLLLHHLGARVTGYALAPPTEPSLFETARIDEIVERSVIADVRDLDQIKKELSAAQPEIVFHMAAQPLVRASYEFPVETYATNVMGTVHVLEAVRQTPGIRAVVNITTDKCYENREWFWGYRENEPMGGYDPYSNSKACSELVTAAYRNSYLNPDRYAEHGVGLASARAGNVIGGGDWAADRLVPDCLRALMAGQPIVIRSPDAIRPWQHVLEPLTGYLALAENLFRDGARFSGAWNFGPDDRDTRPVAWIAERLCARWGGQARVQVQKDNTLHEATYLKLDCSKATSLLGWRPRWPLMHALDAIVDWTKAYSRNDDMRQVCLAQIEEFLAAEEC